MLVLQLIAGACNLWITGHVPRILLVARAHAVPLTTIVQRVSARRIREFQRRTAHIFGLDGTFLTPRLAAAILRFRATRRSSPRAGTPKSVRTSATGNLAEIYIDGLFPCATCCVHLDLEMLSIRWTHKHFISLHTIEHVALKKATRASMQEQASVATSAGGTELANLPGACNCNDGTPNRELRGQSKPTSLHLINRATSANHQIVAVSFSDAGGILNVLELRMPNQMAVAWADGIREVIDMVPRSGSPAQWRWTLSCMAATNRRGTTGYLHRSDVPALLQRANSSKVMSPAALEGLVQSFEQSEDQLALPPWLRAPVGQTDEPLLSAQHASEILLQLCVSSEPIRKLYARHAVDDKVTITEWLRFVHDEQLPQQRTGNSSVTQMREDDADDALATARLTFERATEQRIAKDGKLALRQFALLLLNPQNDAIAPACSRAVQDSLDEPLALYWTACSHKYLRRDANHGPLHSAL